jgi:HTH-type transcriptional regulator/antitoxin HigA
MIRVAILNRRGYREARARLAQLREALSSDAAIADLVAAMSPELAASRRLALQEEHRRLSADIAEYEGLLKHQPIARRKLNISDPGMLPIAGRIIRGLSQRELSNILEMKEQQLQRYEAERYSSISLTGYLRVLKTLGITINGEFAEEELRTLEKEQLAELAISAPLAKEFAKRGWTVNRQVSPSQYIQHGLSLSKSRSYNRLTLRSQSKADIAALLSWHSRILTLAEERRSRNRTRFDFVESNWINELVHLSRERLGPKMAVDFLEQKGVFVVVEPALPHTFIDGAAFLLKSDNPVIGISIRHDRLDNFWFTLMHELGHVFVHFNRGLSEGFLDDNIETVSTAKEEKEADDFALSSLIPNEIWNTSIARFATTAPLIVGFAEEQGISPAIVAGRIRHERADYSIFSRLVGQGAVRRLLLNPQGDGE